MPNLTNKSSPAVIVLGLVSAAFLMFSLTAHPQSGTQSEQTQSGTSSGQSSSGSSTSSAGAASGGQISNTDQNMMTQLAQANISEINAGKLAQQKSENDQVKSFAKKMVDDHTKALDDLKQIAQAKGVTLPTEPSRQQQNMENKLSALSGEQFDRQYIAQSGDRAHKDTHRLLQRASSRAQDPDLKSYASKTLSTIETHQQMAKDTRKNLGTSQGKSGSGTEKSGSGTSGSSTSGTSESGGSSGSSQK